MTVNKYYVMVPAALDQTPAANKIDLSEQRRRKLVEQAQQKGGIELPAQSQLSPIHGC
ncbi:hypothetical protein [Vibrio sp.]|uniref:hypothetical protein n=1 Tax=Vibrio sp. TaxID=678 RepID=UPI003D0FCB70